MKSFVRNNIRRWLILARGKFSPTRTEGANRVMRRVIFSLPLRYVPSLWNLLLFLLILLAVPACKQPTAPDPKPEFSFTIEDASCTEAWLNVKTANFGSGFSFALNRNDSTIWRFAALPPDTIIVDEGLLPNKEYTYELLAISSKIAPVSTGKKKVTTMDTTSHNFTWQTWEFGAYSSVLYDVAIIDENDIWAVGQLNIWDPDQNEIVKYNAVHWDGVEWELKRILFPTVCGSTDRTAFPSRSIIYLQNGIIWAGSSGDKIAVMKDNIQVNQFCLPTSLQMGINKMWGTSDKDIYAVGNSGNIAHYDGVSWKKIESGTTVDFTDIKGKLNHRTGKIEIFLVGQTQPNTIYNRGQLYKLEGKQLTVVNTEGFSLLYYDFDFEPERLYMVAGSGVWRSKYLTREWNRESIIDDDFYQEIIIRDLNEIIVLGNFGNISYYNGVKWIRKVIIDPSWTDYLDYYSADYKNNLLVAVGINTQTNIQAYIKMGRKQ